VWFCVGWFSGGMGMWLYLSIVGMLRTRDEYYEARLKRLRKRLSKEPE